MSSRREVLIRILALLQRKTLIETKNRTLKCLKRHYSTVRSMKNVAVLTEDGAFALFFRPHPGGFDSSRVPIPGNLPSKAKKNANARGSARESARGGGGLGIDRCIRLLMLLCRRERLESLTRLGSSLLNCRHYMGNSSDYGYDDYRHYHPD